MSDLTTKAPEFAPRFLRTPDAAIYVGLSPRTLEKLRTYGTGPSFRKLGGRVVYTLEDLDRWADQGLRRSTCDPDTGTVHPAKRITPGREAGRSAKWALCCWRPKNALIFRTPHLSPTSPRQ